MALTYDDAKRLLDRHEQGHVLRFWDRLDEAGRAALLAQIETLEFDSIARMRAMLRERHTAAAFDPAMEPAPVVEPTAAEAAASAAEGDAALRAGKVGVILVAGGQGSRLGFEGPKGIYPVGPVTGASLFEIHARKVLRLEQRTGAHVPLYIMTSDVNDAPTQAFFSDHERFGLDRDRVKFFVQGMWPALSAEGRILLDAPGHIFMSPDGHGGTLSALRRTGMLADMERRGLETLFYFQVDNPIVEVADPAFVGLHRRAGADISIKVCAKRDAHEGLGVVVARGGRCAIVEYSDLPQAQKEALGADGRLKYLYGSVAIHILSRAFLAQEAAAALPLHIAHKKVPACDDAGRTATPAAPNAYKFEKFIFDIIPDARKALNVAFAREEEFSPLKNASGADSPETVRRDLCRKYGRWLTACGVNVPLDAGGTPTVKIEIDPAYAAGADDLRARLPQGFRVDGDVLLR
jgi:UDP-N-acetylglucosamine/UDP-N-acetylgalactosamine diphosphorylase